MDPTPRKGGIRDKALIPPLFLMKREEDPKTQRQTLPLLHSLKTPPLILIFNIILNINFNKMNPVRTY